MPPKIEEPVLEESVEDNFDNTCPICFEANLEDNDITCCNGHKVCVTCIRHLVVDKGACKNPETCRCTGFTYPCPLCRASNLLLSSHINAVVKGGWKVSDGDGPKEVASPGSKLPPLGPGSQHAQGKINRGKEEKNGASLPAVVLTKKGYTTTCCACRNKNVITQSVTKDGKLLALSCSEGHTLCVDCSRELVGVRGGCTNKDCKNCSKVINASFTCPECKIAYTLDRRHMMVIIKGKWQCSHR
ncbi:hypothetical protein TrCOL_g6037 [Triparma columacea]|uniref:RING-type domain-containing protein n=1 Tax=Triparma columacea TaxID=722753 RepID=A0A9W7GEJ6_9STRA|nr:hypothetical protein TrCOL_g6037 [Triparma columacea]